MPEAAPCLLMHPGRLNFVLMHNFSWLRVNANISRIDID